MDLIALEIFSFLYFYKGKAYSVLGQSVEKINCRHNELLQQYSFHYL